MLATRSANGGTVISWDVSIWGYVHYTCTLLCKVKGQYQLTLQVSRYCLLALHDSTVICVRHGECAPEDTNINWWYVPIMQVNSRLALAQPCVNYWHTGSPLSALYLGFQFIYYDFFPFSALYLSFQLIFYVFYSNVYIYKHDNNSIFLIIICNYRGKNCLAGKLKV